jgi:hypothetical protein
VDNLNFPFSTRLQGGPQNPTRLRQCQIAAHARLRSELRPQASFVPHACHVLQIYISHAAARPQDSFAYGPQNSGSETQQAQVLNNSARRESCWDMKQQLIWPQGFIWPQGVADGLKDSQQALKQLCVLQHWLQSSPSQSLI